MVNVAMADLFRMRKLTIRVSERDYPFVVQITVPDGGFECPPGALDAYRHGSAQPRRQGYLAGERERRGWRFDGVEIARTPSARKTPSARTVDAGVVRAD
jgi:hypothetical protein